MVFMWKKIVVVEEVVGDSIYKISVFFMFLFLFLDFLSKIDKDVLNLISYFCFSFGLSK